MFEFKRQWANHIAGTFRALSIAAGTSSLYGHPGRFNRKAVEALRLVIPYCLHPAGDEDDTLIWLNRDYKPLGTLLAHADYEKFPSVHADPRDPAISKLLREAKSLHVFADGGFVYWLFDDSTAPWKGKQHSVALLAKLGDVLSRAPYDEWPFPSAARPAVSEEDAK